MDRVFFPAHVPLCHVPQDYRPNFNNRQWGPPPPERRQGEYYAGAGDRYPRLHHHYPHHRQGPAPPNPMRHAAYMQPPRHRVFFQDPPQAYAQQVNVYEGRLEDTDYRQVRQAPPPILTTPSPPPPSRATPACMELHAAPNVVEDPDVKAIPKVPQFEDQEAFLELQIQIFEEGARRCAKSLAKLRHRAAGGQEEVEEMEADVKREFVPPPDVKEEEPEVEVIPEPEPVRVPVVIKQEPPTLSDEEFARQMEELGRLQEEEEMAAAPPVQLRRSARLAGRAAN